MLINNLKRITAEGENLPRIYTRNLLKEAVQTYVLNFIYNSTYQDGFLFTGGTCLRFCFGLNRLSEDLDFNVKNYSKFDLDKFLNDLNEYFSGYIQYKDLNIKVAKNRMQVILKLPLLDKVGFAKMQHESKILQVRLDINPLKSKNFNEGISLYSSYDFSFVIKRYEIEDLFASKIVAILSRVFQKGKGPIGVKGRDYYDLIWFLSKDIKPNFERVKDGVDLNSKDQVLKELDKKVYSIEPSHLKEDLLPFFPHSKSVDNFIDNFRDLYKNLRKRL